MNILVVGSTNIDMTIGVDSIAQVGETVIGGGLSYSYGGKGANQACAIAKLGGDITFLTCVGDDSYGHEMMDYLKGLNADVSRVKYSKNKNTGTAFIQVDKNGKNSIVISQGANLECDVDYILDNEDCFEKCDYVLLQLEIPLDAVEKAIELGAKYNKTVILNPAPVNNKLNPELYSKLFCMTPNEVEIVQMVNGMDDMNACAKYLKNEGVKHVIITLGSEGVMYYDAENSVIVPANKVKAIDTVAAGDCFNGAFVYALANGKGIQEAIQFGNCASAIAVTRKGAQASLPTLVEVEAFQKNK